MKTGMKGIGLALGSWSMFFFLVWAEVELPHGVSRRLYCETCLATVREMKKTLNGQSEPSLPKIKDYMRRACETLTLEEQSFAADKANTACKHLLGLYGKKFEQAFLKEKESSLEANLCYVYSTACTGVKRNHLQVQQPEFRDGVIEELLQKHAEKIWISKAVSSNTSQGLEYKKEEL